jgi:hypothetical protein
VRLQTESTPVASRIREVTPAIWVSSTTASWVQPSAAPKRPNPSPSAATASRIVASASAWKGVIPAPTRGSPACCEPAFSVVSGEVMVGATRRRAERIGPQAAILPPVDPNSIELSWDAAREAAGLD